MDEAGWLASVDPQELLAWLRTSPGRAIPFASERKLRLFACACCRQVWHLLGDERSRQTVEVAERYADGEATLAELNAARHDAWAARESAWSVARDAAWAAWDAARGASWSAAWPTSDASWAAAWDAGRAASQEAAWAGSPASPQDCWQVQCALLRDLMGNPWRPLHIEDQWVSAEDTNGGAFSLPLPNLWLTPTVLCMARVIARVIYDTRDFAALPILADALEEAGCSSVDILTHLRSSGPHARGCWALDLVLGKG